VIFVDATVPIALIGAEQRVKARAEQLIEREIIAQTRIVTDAVVLLELIERYAASGCPEAIEPAFEALLGMADEVLSIEPEDVVRAKEMLYGPERLGANECLHLAVMERHHVHRIVSFHPAYDRYPAVSRSSEP
jgi:predicted nucleic acid-binding protein